MTHRYNLFTHPFFLLAAFMPRLAAAAFPRTVPEIVAKLCVVLDWVFAVAIVVGVVYIIVAAFQYTTSGGSEDKVRAAHQAVLYATIGIVVAIAAKSVPLVLADIFDVTGVSACP